MSITIVIADDHTVVREGLRLLFERKQDIKIVGEAATGKEAVHQTVRLKPDVVIMDIAMPVLNGIAATLQIRGLVTSTRVIILSMHSNTEHLNRAFKAGAQGYVLKESTGAEVIDAVRTVLAGRRYVSKKIADTLVDEYVNNQRGKRKIDPVESLSPREREILQLVVEGKSSAEIAELIFLSPKTVETYRSRLMHKLGLKNLPDLVKFAIQKGLLSLE